MVTPGNKQSLWLSRVFDFPRRAIETIFTGR